VLVSPQIPPNTGTIARMCAAFAMRLHLVEPLGFDLSEKAVRRAGLDYWENVDVHVHGSLDALDAVTLGRRWVFIETGGEVSPSEFIFDTNDLLVLGSETKGIPQVWMDQLLSEGRGVIVTLPMYSSQVRSINLSCAASMVIFQATEQLRKKVLRSAKSLHK
jgi:tRNA (cytidine/uridine-2'-O-)-methyltransferase